MFAAGKVASPSSNTDPQFNYVAALLHGNGTNGATNSTFLESSNSIPVTTGGNTLQGTFSPYIPTVGYWSCLSSTAAGTTNSITVNTTAALNTISGDFTFECWAMRKSISSFNVLMMSAGLTATSIIRLSSNGTWLVYTTNITAAEADSRVFAAPNKWFHIAVVRQSGTVYVYINGTLVKSFAFTSTVSFSGGTGSNRALIGAYNNGSNQEWTGYISNLRVVIGTAVYTSNFTPSIVPLTAISGTQLLLFQDNQIKDNSPNNCSFTFVGNPGTANTSPFTNLPPYSASVYGGSAYCGAIGDKLSFTEPSPTSGDATVEIWFYPTAAPTAAAWVFNDTGNGLGAWGISYDTTYALNAYINDLVTVRITTTNLVRRNNWNHAAIVKSAGVVYLYLNGIRASTSYTQSGNFGRATGNIVLGDYTETPGGSYIFTGYLSDFRYTKSAVYTGATYTMPTAPLTAIANTAALLNMTNAGVIDNAMKNEPQLVGTARISTAQSKFGGGSLLFEGSGNYLLYPSNLLYQVNSGDFTIEMWIYPTATITDSIVLGTNLTTTGFGLRLTGTTVQVVSLPTTSRLSATYTVPLNTWTYIAVNRQGTTMNIYINGSLSATATVSTVFTQSGLTIGAGIAGAQPFTGYIDEVRFTNYYRTISGSPSSEFPNS